MWAWVTVSLVVLGLFGLLVWLPLQAREVVRKGLKLLREIEAASERASAAAAGDDAAGERPTMASHDPGGRS